MTHPSWAWNWNHDERMSLNPFCNIHYAEKNIVRMQRLSEWRPAWSVWILKLMVRVPVGPTPLPPLPPSTSRDGLRIEISKCDNTTQESCTIPRENFVGNWMLNVPSARSVARENLNLLHRPKRYRSPCDINDHGFFWFSVDNRDGIWRGLTLSACYLDAHGFNISACWWWRDKDVALQFQVHHSIAWAQSTGDSRLVQ